MDRAGRFLIRWSGIGVALLAVLLFTIPLWTSPDPFIGSGTDLVTFEHPFHSFATERLRHGDLPLWNPYELGGVPFEAGVHGHLSPSYWSLYFLPPLADLGFGFVIHLMLAAAGMAYWASRRGLSREAQALAGITYALSAFMLLHCFGGHRRLVFTAAHLPWVAAFAQDVTRTGRRWIPAALATGLAVWCGHYHVLYLGFVGLSLFLLIEAWIGEGSVLSRVRSAALGRAALARAALGLVTLFAAGAALASIRLLPVLDTLRASQRSGGGAEFAASYASAPANLLTFFWPHLFGNRVDVRFIGEWSYWESLGFVGVLPLLLVFLAPVVLRGGKWIAGWVLLAFGVTLSLGAATPLFDLYLHVVPGAQLFRSPGRYVFWVSLFAPILAAEVLHAWLHADPRKPRRDGAARAARVALLLAPAVAFGGWIAAQAGGVGGWQRWLLTFGAQIKGASLPSDVWSRLHQLALADGLRAALVLAVGAALLLAGRRLPQNARAWGVVALVFVELAVFGQRFLVTGPASRFEWPHGVTEFLQGQNDPGLRILDHPDLRSPGRGAAFGVAQIGGYDTFVPADYMRYVRTSRGLDPEAIVSWYQTRATNPAVDRLGARFYLHRGALDPHEAVRRGFAGWAEVARCDSVFVYENPNPEPRAFVVHAVRIAAEAETFRALADTNVHLRDAMLVEKSPPPEFHFERAAEESPGRESARIVSYEPDRVVIEAQVERAGAVVLSDNWHRDWRCRIDGREVPVVRANAIMRAVPVEPGAHEIVFEFRSRAFALGVAGSLSSLALLGAFAFYDRRRASRIVPSSGSETSKAVSKRASRQARKPATRSM